MFNLPLFKSARAGLVSFVVVGALFAQPAKQVLLTLNENPYGPSPLAVEAVQKDIPGLFRYVGDEADAFVKQVAAHEGVPPAHIVVGDSLEVLGLQLALEGGPGSEFIYSLPGYPALVDATAPLGGVSVPVPLDANYENDLPAIAAKINSHTRAIFLVNPHNPTGTVSDAKAFKAFVHTASQRTLVIVDEAYLEFSDDYAGRTVLDLVKAGDNVLIYRTFSKVYGLAALPLGYSVAPVKIADALRKAGVGAPRSLNRLALVAAGASLRDTGYIARVQTAIATERLKWGTFLSKLGLKASASQGNFVYFDTGRPVAGLAKELLAAGVVVARPFPPFDTWVRITIGLPEENEKARVVVKKLLAAKK
jgi:histidinol-phosphate aminotransferase